MSKLILKGSERLNFICRSKKYVILFSVAEMSGGRNVRGRNVLAETSVAEMSGAEMSEHQIYMGVLHLKYTAYSMHEEEKITQRTKYRHKITCSQQSGA